MSRRDMIVIAALLNGAILASLLMMTATNDEPRLIPYIEPLQEFSKGVNPTDAPLKTTLVNDLSKSSFDPDFQDFGLAHSELIIQEDDVTLFPLEQEIEVDLSPSNVVDITVKSGDVLERIARTNGTTVEAIKELNQLKSERLRIGQILKVPVNTAPIKTIEAPKPALQQISADTVYYTIKSGDNPWKIARQFHVKMDDLLRLNNLDEEKARNLKVGDRIRIR